jgi:hypothetical protein
MEKPQVMTVRSFFEKKMVTNQLALSNLEAVSLEPLVQAVQSRAVSLS